MHQVVAVTGATGFIGQNLLDALIHDGWLVNALTRKQPSKNHHKNIKWVLGDLDDHTALLELVTRASAIIHCAGLVRGTSPEVFFHANAIGTENLLKAVASVKLNPRFLLISTSDYVPGWDFGSDAYIQFPDLTIWMVRGMALYKTNPNFSLRAIQYQTEAQRKTATSLLRGIAYQYNVIDNESQSSTSSQRSNNLILLAQINYYATLVLHKKWYATLGLGAGGGFYYTWLLTRQPSGNIESTLSSGVFRGYFNGGVGYNANRFFAGAELLHYQSFTKQPTNIDMVFTRTAFQIFVGYRFSAPRFIKNSLDKAGRFL